MNFNSPEFLFFLPVVLLLYTIVFRHERARDLLLLAASYFFYMSWNWRYAGLLLFSTLIDFFVAQRIHAAGGPRRRRGWVSVSIVVQLGLLATFKYWNFFVESLGDAAHWLGGEMTLARHHLLLPVGISFYTFQTLSYTIDVYRGKIPPERSLMRFAIFASFFPQLVAGPIARASDFLPQIARIPNVARDRIDTGFALIFRGLAKKILLADLLAGLAVDEVFRDPSAHSSLELLLALYGYAFQIYNDFSGYTDIAIGSARVLGYDLPKNFDRPYQSRSLREFWTRWHISLSSWLRDYLYVSLGGNRRGEARTRVNLFLTMLLGGLWHGAAGHFVLWGAYHGLLLAIGRRAGGRVPEGGPIGRALRVAGTFHVVTFGWLLFRAPDLATFEQYVRGLAAGTTELHLSSAYLAVLATAALVHALPRSRIEAADARLFAAPLPLRGALYAGALLVYCAAALGAPAFIYFQF